MILQTPDQLVWTCTKNNAGELGERPYGTMHGLFQQVRELIGLLSIIRKAKGRESQPRSCKYSAIGIDPKRSWARLALSGLICGVLIGFALYSKKGGVLTHHPFASGAGQRHSITRVLSAVHR